MTAVADAKTTWGVGEYPLMAEALDPAARSVVEIAEISTGERVVDVATGTGNAALLAAARGAEVIAIDLEPALLRLAEQRAQALDAELSWVEGDAQALPVDARWADAVLSVFGAMYAPDHLATARELVRVAASRGRIVLSAWTPQSLMSRMGAVLSSYLPPPPAASGPPSRWGDPSVVRGLLAAAGATLMRTEADQVVLAFADPREAADFLIRTAGHVVSHRATLVSSGRWQALNDDLARFADAHGDHHDGQLRLQLEYLVAVAAPNG